MIQSYQVIKKQHILIYLHNLKSFVKLVVKMIRTFAPVTWRKGSDGGESHPLTHSLKCDDPTLSSIA